jgi:MFS superfamily sulfate permease-like transporter
MGDATRFGELSAALAILVGLVLVALGVLHMGFVSRFISAAVQAGFMFGLGLTIIVGQVPALLVVVAGIVVVALGDLAGRGVDVIGEIEGAVPVPALPPAGPGADRHRPGQRPGRPVPGLHHRRRGQPVGRQRPRRRPHPAGVAAGVGADRADRGGAAAAVPRPPPGRPGRDRDQRRPRVPQPARPAADPAAAPRQLRLAIFTLLGVPLLGVLGGLLLAVVISILLLLNRQSRPGTSVLGRVPPGDVYVAIDHEPAARTEPGLLVLRLDAPLLFINARLLRDRVREQLAAAETPVRIVLLDLQFTPELDVESLDVLTALRGELFQRGVALWLANARADVRDLLRRSGLAEAVGEARICRSPADAIPDTRAALRP